MMDAKTKALRAIAEGACPNAAKRGCKAAGGYRFCAPCIAREALKGSYTTETRVMELKCEPA